MLKIVTLPSPVLSTATQRVSRFDLKLKKLVDRMTATMRLSNGIGLAANQIGESWQVMVIEVSGSQKLKIPLTVVVNPKLVSRSAKKIIHQEACLSVPGKEVEVSRAEQVKVKGFNPKGKKITIAAKGLFARIIQHELDHLNGILITDRGKVLKHEDKS